MLMKRIFNMTQTTFRDCRVHFYAFSDNLSRNSCKQQSFIWGGSTPKSKSLSFYILTETVHLSYTFRRKWYPHIHIILKGLFKYLNDNFPQPFSILQFVKMLILSYTCSLKKVLFPVSPLPSSV